MMTEVTKTAHGMRKTGQHRIGEARSLRVENLWNQFEITGVSKGVSERALVTRQC